MIDTQLYLKAREGPSEKRGTGKQSPKAGFASLFLDSRHGSAIAQGSMTDSARGTNPLRPSFRIHSRTDVGRRRKRNEDCLGVLQRHGVFVVADGMGGVDGGDYSSRCVIDTITESFFSLQPEDLSYRSKLNLVEECINRASARIFEEADRRGIHGMGTTVVVICFNLQTMKDACILHAGDSRVYRRRNRAIDALTRDHSMAAESGLSDNAMIPIFMAGVITRAVGVRDEVEVDRTPVDVRKGDQFLLCSDGLYNMLPLHQMTALLNQAPEDPSATLVNAANDAGGFDNITVVLVEVLEGEGPGNLDETQY